jgi:hypothetical protein
MCWNKDALRTIIESIVGVLMSYWIFTFGWRRDSFWITSMGFARSWWCRERRDIFFGIFLLLSPHLMILRISWYGESFGFGLWMICWWFPGKENGRGGVLLEALRSHQRYKACSFFILAREAIPRTSFPFFGRKRRRELFLSRWLEGVQRESVYTLNAI